MSGDVMRNVFGGSKSTSSSQSSNTPVDMTPPAFAALQSPFASTVQSYFGGGPTYGGVASAGAPLTPNAQPTDASTFAAPLSPTETQLLSTINGVGGQTGAPMNSALNYTNSVLQPSFMDPSQNPMLQQQITNAVNPIVTQFQRQTMPNLTGQFVANGAVLNGPALQGGPVDPATGLAAGTGQGNSAFSTAAALAKTGELNAIGTATNQVQDQFRQQQEAAATQAGQLSTQQINDLVTTLQAEALPRLVQQYGMDQGLQEFNNRVNVMLQSLGLAGSKAGPDIAQNAQSSSSGQNVSDTGIVPAIGGGSGAAKLAAA